MPSYKATIKVNKLDKSAFFKGKNGDTYCSVILWENKDGPDQFDNTHSIKQDLGKERKGEKSDYVGNAKQIGGGNGPGRDVSAAEATRRSQPAGAPAARDNSASEPDDSDAIPFARKPAIFQP